MTTITLKYEWDMGHRLPLHDGKCARLHGHRYVAEIDLTGSLQLQGPGTGMVVDFYVLKDIIKSTIGDWDHRTMLFEDDPISLDSGAEIHNQSDLEDLFGIFRVPFMPTAENIAHQVLKLVNQELRSDTKPFVVCTRVRIYETPNGWAEVRA